jgi:hypothetical protein
MLEASKFAASLPRVKRYRNFHVAPDRLNGVDPTVLGNDGKTVLHRLAQPRYPVPFRNETAPSEASAAECRHLRIAMCVLEHSANFRWSGHLFTATNLAQVHGQTVFAAKLLEWEAEHEENMKWRSGEARDGLSLDKGDGSFGEGNEDADDENARLSVETSRHSDAQDRVGDEATAKNDGRSSNDNDGVASQNADVRNGAMPPTVQSSEHSDAHDVGDEARAKDGGWYEKTFKKELSQAIPDSALRSLHREQVKVPERSLEDATIDLGADDFGMDEVGDYADGLSEAMMRPEHGEETPESAAPDESSAAVDSSHDLSGTLEVEQTNAAGVGEPGESPELVTDSNPAMSETSKTEAAGAIPAESSSELAAPETQMQWQLDLEKAKKKTSLHPVGAAPPPPPHGMLAAPRMPSPARG